MTAELETVEALIARHERETRDRFPRALDRKEAPWRQHASRQAAELITCCREWQERALAAEREVTRLDGLVYVPGVKKCAKCSCVLVSTNLHVPAGGFSADNSPQECPNGCGPMWRRTERETGNELCDRLDKAANELNAMRGERDQAYARAAEVCREELEASEALKSGLEQGSIRSFYEGSASSAFSCNQAILALASQTGGKPYLAIPNDVAGGTNYI